MTEARRRFGPRLWVGAVGAVLAIALLLAFATRRGPAAPAGRKGSVAAAPLAAPPTGPDRGSVGGAPLGVGLPSGEEPSAGSHPIPRELPRSLRGTEVDGSFRVGADGHLVPDPDALSVFNYFLAASGEEPIGVLRARIVAYIEGSLDPPAAGEAVALLDTYLGFRDAARELTESGQAPADLERRLQWIRELRRQHFGAATAEALFAEDEQMVAVDLERRRIAMDAGLDETERAERLAALEEDLPESVRDARQRARAPARVRGEVEALRAAGGSQAEVFDLREQRFGSEAAERLAALDAERARWNDRLASYRDERDRLLEETPDASVDRDEALAELRRAHFEDPDERRRVRALDGF